MKVIVTNIEFDLSLDEEEAWELDDPEMLQTQLQHAYTGEAFIVEDEENLANQISEMTGWCVQTINYKLAE